MPGSPHSRDGQPYSWRVLPPAWFRRGARPRLRPGLLVTLLALVALAVLAVGGYGVITHLDRPIPPSADQVIQDAAHTTAAMTSVSANFTTQASGITVMFGTVHQRVAPASLATLSMTSVDGVDRFAVTEVVTRSTVYVRMPSLSAAFGKPWIGISVPELGASPAMSQLYQTAALPTVEAALIGTASTEKMTGTTTVRGVTVSRYVGSIDPATALAELAPDVRQLLAPELTATTGSVRFTAWIDSQHNLRKIQTSVIIGGQLTVTTIVVTAINRELHMVVPQPDQVAAVPRQPPAAG